MNVLHLISSGGFFGAERVLLNLADGLKKQGVNPWVAGIRNAHNPHLEIVSEAEKRGLAAVVIDSKGRWDSSAVSSLANLVVKNKIDIIHSHNYKANLIAALASQKTHIPMVATNHLWTGGNLKLRFYELLDGFILGRYARKVVAVAGTIKKDMMRCGVNASKIEVIFNGIDSDRAVENGKDLRKELAISPSSIVIGVVARLSPEKGHIFLFRALQALAEEFPELLLLIVGEGPLLESLKLKIKNEKLENSVIFAGYHKDMAAVYKAIDILAQPSLGEGLPMTLLEAMSLGKPVVATNVGATAELIRNTETGLLIPRGSVDALVTALRSFIKDTDFGKRCGENARQLVKSEFSLDKMLSSYRKVYDKVLSLEKPKA